ncbi:MAG: endonuclease V [Burkholderiaceae bacterium]|nr:endonuclease V [Burkholderiaceae bacterium]
MKLAVDVHYDAEGAQAAAVAFDDWGAAEALRTYTSRIAHVEKAPRGELDLRELPCLLQLLREHALDPEVIVIDGFVHLDAQETPGMGQHLFHALGGRVAIIGISKTAMVDTPAQFEVFREEEARPLIVTCAGIDLGAAKARLRAMHGRKRVPTLLKMVARLAKAAVG